MTINTLVSRAQSSTAWRGHRMRWVKGPAFAAARCIYCDAWVQCEVRPAPNSIDIGGSAVATNCVRPR